MWVWVFNTDNLILVVFSIYDTETVHLWSLSYADFLMFNQIFVFLPQGHE